MRKRPISVPMPTTARPQRRYDHRLRHLVRCTGEVTVATDLRIPRSTALGWLGAAPTVVVCLDIAASLSRSSEGGAEAPPSGIRDEAGHGE